MAASDTQPRGSTTLKRISVNVFNAGFVWPLWVAQDKGFFAVNGLDVRLIATPNSVAQMRGLIDGEFDIAMTAIDNVIAYMEGQGEAATQATPDIIAVMGSDNGFLSLISAPDIKNISDLRGRTLSVDALTTGYAFALQKLLELNGLASDDYTLARVGGMRERYEALQANLHAGTLSVPPYDLLLQKQGYNNLGKVVDNLTHYQGVVAATRRAWTHEHEVEIVAFIHANIAAINWLYSSENKSEAIALYQSHLPRSSLEIAEQSYSVFLDPRTGFDRRAAIDVAGVRQVMQIRSQYGNPHKTLLDPAKYYDLFYYKQAIEQVT